MSVVVAISPQFTGEPTPALSAGLRALKSDNELLVAVLYRDMDRVTDDEVDDEIDAVTDYLSSTGRAFRVIPATADKDMAEALCDIATEYEAHVIVVEIERQAPGGRNLLGTQAQRLILEASCSVLVARE